MESLKTVNKTVSEKYDSFMDMDLNEEEIAEINLEITEMNR